MAPVGGEDGGTGPSLVELGQQCLRQGDPAAAVKHLQEALKEPGGATVDAHLILAEALWQETGGQGTDKALPHYEAAGKLASAAGDSSKQAMVAIGHGFALTQLGRAEAALKQLEQAKVLAEADENEGAVRFVERLMEQAKASAPPAEGPESVRATWQHFAEALASGKPAVLFMRGPFAAPADADSQRGVSKLRAAGCTGLEVVDVCSPGADVPDGLQAISDSAHLAFPQLFVAGAECKAWLEAELSAEELRRRLTEAGAPMGEPHEEPCHGTAAFAEGLEPWEVALVESVSQNGTGDWPLLARKLREKGVPGPHGGGSEEEAAAALEAEWARLSPLVRDKLEAQPEMPCGHSCSTCPTRHDCQLHDAVGDGSKARDIEDLA